MPINDQNEINSTFGEYRISLPATYMMQAIYMHEAAKAIFKAR